MAVLGCAVLVVLLGGCTQTGSAPTVSSTQPADLVTNVATNTRLAIVFSRAMDGQTITTSTFTLLQGATPVSGTVVNGGLNAVFNPAANLAPNTLYTATISAGATDASGTALASDYVWSFTTGAGPDTTAPMVSAASPADYVTNPPINTYLSATFTEAMNPLSFTTASFLLYQGSTPVAGSVSGTGITAVFKPSANLTPSTLYTAKITTGAVDLAGNALVTNVSGVTSNTNYTWTFTTGTGSDTTAPMLSTTDPPHGATGVPTGHRVSATFSEVMDPLSISTSTFALVQGTTPVPGTVNYSGVTAVFTPAVDLAPNTEYMATVTTGAVDLCKNPLAIGRTWTFTTGADPAAATPEVSHTLPEKNATNGTLYGNISATFTKPMDPMTINSDSFNLIQETSSTTTATPVPFPLAGRVTYSGVTAVFTPEEALTAGETYSASVSMNATDLDGNPLSEDHTWAFTTSGTIDTTAPVVSATMPANSATGLPVNRKIAAVFSELMNPLSISTATFTLMHGADSVIGTVYWSGVTATFNPKGNLATNTQYTARIAANTVDLSGNSLGSAYGWSFTTGGGTDTAAPEVGATFPADGAAAAVVNQRIAAVFSKAMSPLTIDTQSFTLMRGAMPVSGAVITSGLTAIFTPDVDLTPSTAYTATISAGAADLAGNTLAGGHSWTFTTGGVTDLIAPTVSSVSPASSTTAVSVSGKVTATFSEAMNPLAVNAKTFTLVHGTTPVTGAVTLSGQTATFTPATALLGRTVYTASILTGAADLAGNTLATAYTWSFTTGAVPVSTAPTVTSTSPAGNATGVTLGTKITATFSEAMAPWSLSTATFTLTQGGLPLSGTVSYASGTATFTPLIALAPNTAYTVVISTGATDANGNALANSYVWSFTTGAT